MNFYELLKNLFGCNLDYFLMNIDDLRKEIGKKVLYKKIICPQIWSVKISVLEDMIIEKVKQNKKCLERELKKAYGDKEFLELILCTKETKVVSQNELFDEFYYVLRYKDKEALYHVGENCCHFDLYFDDVEFLIIDEFYKGIYIIHDKKNERYALLVLGEEEIYDYKNGNVTWYQELPKNGTLKTLVNATLNKKL